MSCEELLWKRYTAKVNLLTDNRTLCWCSTNSLRRRLDQKNWRTKVPRIFRIFVPNFAPNLLRIFPELFVLRFVGNAETRKNHQEPPPFFNAKFPGKFEERIHKSFLESGQSKKGGSCESYGPPFGMFSWEGGRLRAGKPLQ